MRNGSRLLLISVGFAATLSAQAPRPEFEVASVKKLVERSESGSVDLFAPSTGLYYSNATAAVLIQFAYNVLPFELIGGPAWMRSDRFEINARAATVASPEEKRLMMQSLLADRFKLVVRRDKQEMAHSALVFARADRRLGPNFMDCPAPNAPEPQPRPPRGGGLWVVRCGTSADLRQLVSISLQTPVIDETGLTGRWQILITALDPRQPPSSAPPRPTDDPNLTDMRTALQEQLGLKLESRRGPVDVLVVDSIEQPTPD
jgi:uncharacterized protein (TIGR03435 family)